MRPALFVAIAFASASAIAQTSPSAIQREIITRAVHSTIDRQKTEWDDWKNADDHRVVLLADETMPFPKFADGDAMEYRASIFMENRALSSQLEKAPILTLRDWKLIPRSDCSGTPEALPAVRLVPPSTIERVFKGKPLDPSVALAIRMTTPVLSPDGRQAALYLEYVGSHVDDSGRQLTTMSRNDRPSEWDDINEIGRLLPIDAATPQECEISVDDRAVMTSALTWLTSQKGHFDLLGLFDRGGSPSDWRYQLRSGDCHVDVGEGTLAQLQRRNTAEQTFDPSTLPIAGVRTLDVGDSRIWSEPSVLVSLPAYGNDIAILFMTYRTASRKPEDIVETSSYLVVVRRSDSGSWSVVWTNVLESVMIT